MSNLEPQTKPDGGASESTAELGVFFIPENNRLNPEQCCGKFGTPQEWQCMWLAHDDVFDKGVCEWGGGRVAVHDVYVRPKHCPLTTPND